MSSITTTTHAYSIPQVAIDRLNNAVTAQSIAMLCSNMQGSEFYTHIALEVNHPDGGQIAATLVCAVSFYPEDDAPVDVFFDHILEMYACGTTCKERDTFDFYVSDAFEQAITSFARRRAELLA